MRVAPRVADAFQKGGGVPFGDFGPDCVHALDLINPYRPDQYRFTDYWLKALPEVVAKLQAGGRVLDYGCGSGQACMALAKRASQCGSGRLLGRLGLDCGWAGDLSSNVYFSRKPPASWTRGAGFDLVTICDCVHDFAAAGRNTPADERAAEARRGRSSSWNRRPRTGWKTTAIRWRRCSTASASSTA